MNSLVPIQPPGRYVPLWSEDAPPPASPPLLRRRLRLAGGLMAAMLLVAALVPIGGAVIAAGQVGIESQVKRIAHPTGGVIAQIAVRNGQHVERGALLVRLDDRVSGAEADYSGLSVEQLLAQRARLEAERMGAPGIAFPPELTMANSANAKAAMADEARLFAIRRAEVGQIRAQLAARVAQFGEQIRGIEAQIASLQEQRKLIEPERKGIADLWERRLVTINRKNQLERTVSELEGSIAAQQAQIARTRAQISETREQQIQTDQSRRSQAGSELAQVNSALNEQRVRAISAGDRQSRSEIRAPYSGTVEKLAFAAVGDVIKPADAILEIVPDREGMVVEAMINPADIDRVRAGAPARVRFTSFNRAATPEIAGKLLYVATDRTTAPDGHSAFYLARLSVDPAALERAGMDLRSGMPAEIYIETGSRSLFSYLAKPLRDQFARAFRSD